MNINKKILAVVLFCAGLVFYFSGVGFGLGFLGQLFFALVCFILLYVAGKGGWERFYLVSLVTSTTMLSLGCAFLAPTGMTGPFVTDFRMSPVMILIASVFIGAMAMIWYNKNGFKDLRLYCLIVLF